MGVYKDIKNKIKTELESIQKDGSDLYVSVHTAPRNQYDGFPSAVIVPGGTESDYGSVAENDRTQTFTVLTNISIANTSDGAVETAFDTMYDIIDLVMNHFDSKPDLDGLVIYTNPSFGDWGQDSDGNFLYFTMNLEVRHSVNIYTS